jgi:circadian clock protein KaiC
MDSWILMSTEEEERRRRRWLFVLKSRGMPHSDEMREFRFTEQGIRILPSAGADREGR